jgi:glycerol kinase
LKKLILSIDQGTTSSRSILFDLKGKKVFSSQYEFKQIFPNLGWVEHNPEDIWRVTLRTIKESIKKSKRLKAKIISIGITNQRETTILWNKKTGKPVYNAIVWQDRRTNKICENLKKKNLKVYLEKKLDCSLIHIFQPQK